MKPFFLTLIFMILGLAPALAADDGLYDPVAPAGSAFVRFINTGLSRGAVEMEITGKKYDEVGYGVIGPYVPVAAGKIDVSFGTLGKNIEVEAGSFYSMALRGNDVVVLRDTPLTDPTKAMVSLYNLTGKNDLALKTADDKTLEIIPPVASKQSGARAINSLPVALAVHEGGQTTAVPSISLKRGAITNILVYQDDKGGLAITTSFSATDTTQ